MLYKKNWNSKIWLKLLIRNNGTHVYDFFHDFPFTYFIHLIHFLNKCFLRAYYVLLLWTLVNKVRYISFCRNSLLVDFTSSSLTFLEPSSQDATLPPETAFLEITNYPHIVKPSLQLTGIRIFWYSYSLSLHLASETPPLLFFSYLTDHYFFFSSARPFPSSRLLFLWLKAQSLSLFSIYIHFRGNFIKWLHN